MHKDLKPSKGWQLSLPRSGKSWRPLSRAAPTRRSRMTLALNGHTIEVHRASVMTKMQATSLSHLVRMMLLAAP